MSWYLTASRMKRISDGRCISARTSGLLRPALLGQRLMPASTLRTYRNGRLVRGCGLVTVRQRPGTAKGVMFVTLEDETGNVNVIIWLSLLERFRREAFGAELLAVYGIWQCEGEIRHLVAQRLVDMSQLLGALATVSRNFH
jgi:error-prone DNA polymerase